jgi:uncharacterized delta-60 repeat protein
VISLLFSGKSQSSFRPSLEALEARTLLNAGNLDSSFGTGGLVTNPLIDGGFTGLVQQPDGKLLTAGASGHNTVLDRYNADGTPDSTFGSGGQIIASLGISTPVLLALQADGKIVVAGNSENGNAIEAVVERYLPSGSIDAAFGSAGKETVTDLAGVGFTIQTDGKIVLAGTAGFGGVTVKVIRLNSDGTIDTAFGSNGLATIVMNGGGSLDARGVAVQASGRIVVAAADSRNGALVGFTPNGSLDPGFGTAGITISPGTTHPRVTLLPDGRILVVSIAVGSNHNFDFAIQRYHANGNLDASFGNQGATLTDFGDQDLPSVVVVEPDGRYLAAGLTFGPEGGAAFARYNPNGNLDTSFGTDGKMLVSFLGFDSSSGVVVQADGRIVSAGSTGIGNGVAAMERLTADTRLPSANQRFVAQAYLDLLGRPVDSNGLAEWSSLLDKGTSRAQVILDIESSPEFANYTINALYARYLGRTVDPSGLNDAANSFRTGGTVEQLIDTLVSSQEFLQGRGKGTRDGFLDALYQDALNRAVDPSGRAAWDQALGNGADYAQVAAGILASAEYRQKAVQEAYGLLLRRQPDPEGLNGFVSLLGHGERDELLIALIAGSDEYFQRV